MDSFTEVLIENLLSYFLIFIIGLWVVIYYLRNSKKKSKSVEEKIEKAKEFGFYEPVSLSPKINYDICIGSGACVAACPEKDILGLVNGRAATINASRCVGHGACFHACPVQAITLVIGTEKRGVDLPHVKPTYETNVPGIYIAGELGGMGLIKNAAEQGKQAVNNIYKSLSDKKNNDYDLVIIGAGPAGISASLTAKKLGLKFITIDQDSLGGTVFTFPRSKVVMTKPMELDLYGKLKLVETSKSELISIWNEVLSKNNISINENEKVIDIKKDNYGFNVVTSKSKYNASKVILAIGRRGSPRKLNVPGEGKEKVFYRLLEPELLKEKNVLIVGGGDSAVESALLLSEENNVTISYRNNSFSRLKPKNHEKILEAIDSNKLKVIYESNVIEICDNEVKLRVNENEIVIANDLVYIFAGGELPNTFLEKIGIDISKKFGEAILKHHS
ncbi:MAG: 4Fe-4S ferredoxin [Ignavibacteriae bacterium]|nr:4Fe-4S ferredoxin [Ignavibacteriota bacterium]